MCIYCCFRSSVDGLANQSKGKDLTDRRDVEKTLLRRGLGEDIEFWQRRASENVMDADLRLGPMDFRLRVSRCSLVTMEGR